MQIQGELRVIDSEPELAALIRQGRVTSATPVYDVASASRSLEDVPDLAHLMPEPPTSEPPIRQDQRSRERQLFSEELAVLNRPLEDDVEYYDEVPVRRWPKRLVVLVVLTAAAMGAYPLFASRLGGLRALATTRLAGGAGTPVAPASIARSEVKAAGVSAVAAVPQPPAPAASETRPVREVTPPSSGDSEPQPDAVRAAAVDSSNAGSHQASHRMKHRSSRNRSASRH